MASITTTYNGLTMNAANEYLTFELDGLNGIPIRSSITPVTGGAGANLWEQQFDARIVTMTGQIKGDTAADYFTRKAEFLNAMQPGTERDLTFTMWDGSTKKIPAFVFQQPIIVERTGKINFNDFQVQFFCQDPFFQSIDAVTLEITGFSGGGSPLGLAVPFVLTSVNNSGSVNNVGDIAVYPTIRIDGKFSTIAINNTTTGEFVTVNAVIPSGAYVQASRTVRGEFITYNGTSNFQQFFPRRLFTLQPGVNTIVVTGSGTDGTSKVTISFNPKYNAIQ